VDEGGDEVLPVPPRGERDAREVQDDEDDEDDRRAVVELGDPLDAPVGVPRV
jgi:hypothetical protein